MVNLPGETRKQYIVRRPQPSARVRPSHASGLRAIPITYQSGDDVVCQPGVQQTHQRVDGERSLDRDQHTGLDVERCFQPAEDLLPVACIQFNPVEGRNLFRGRAGHIADRVNDELANEPGCHERGHF